MIHRGHEQEALALMQSYLPRDSGAAGAGYSEGGGLYALGLIHANHGAAITDYLLGQLKDAQNEVRSIHTNFFILELYYLYKTFLSNFICLII